MIWHLRTLLQTFRPALKVIRLARRQLSNVPKEVDIEKIRNIGIIAHIDAGKTTTTERMLYYSGFSESMGEVHDGDTIMDYMAQERERGITITSAAITFVWKKHRINLIDTPGHVDFTIEVERSLCAIDGGIIILDSSAGVEVQTVTVWNQAKRYNLPCIGFLNKMDKVTSNFEMSVNSLHQKLKVKPLVLQLPLGQGKSFNGVVDLVSKRIIRWDVSSSRHDGTVFKIDSLTEDNTTAWAKRTELIETIADLDDLSADKLIIDGPDSFSIKDLVAAIRRITIKQDAVPVLCGSSYKNVAVQMLMDAVVLYLPNPLEKSQRLMSVDDKIRALVFKIIHDKRKGPLTFLRLYSGKLESGQRVYNLNQQKSEKITNLLIPLADDFHEINMLSAGNIGVVSGLKDCITGDTFVNSQTNVNESGSDYVPLIQVPDPVFFCTIEPPSLAKQRQFETALQCLQREDPTFVVEYDEDIGQTVISGMGELHIEVMKDRLLKEYGLETFIGPLRVAYRETLSQTGSHEYVLEKNLGGIKHFVRILLKMKPNPNSGKFRDVKVVVTKDNDLGKIRPDYLKCVNSGVSSALLHGPILGFPVIDVSVSLLWLDVGKGTSGPMITAAAMQCISHILKTSQLYLLEPIMKLAISAIPGCAGRILSDLNQRRSQILLVEALSDVEVIQTKTPLSELRGYSTILRAISSGSCSFIMEFDCYERMNSQDQSNAIREVTGFEP